MRTGTWSWYRAVVVTALLAGSAHAGGDFCLSSTSPPNPAPDTNPDIVIIAPGFKVPKAGKCRPIVGWEIGYHETYPRTVAGTACLNSAETLLHVGATVHPTFRVGVPLLSQKAYEAIDVHMVLPYPALVDGNVVIHRASFFATDSFRTIRGDGVAGPCFGNLKVPIP